MQAASVMNQATDSKPWYRHRWPWLLMLGPFLVIIAGAITTWLAVTRPDAMVVDDYYVRGKAINQDLRRDRVAAQMQMRMRAHYSQAEGRLGGVLTSAGVPVQGRIRIHLAHPTQPEKDLQLIADTGQDGHFSVSLALFERARWQVLVENEQRDWRLNGSWKWPEQQAIAIAADLAPAE